MDNFEFAVEVKYTRRRGSIGIRINPDGVCLLAPHRTPKATLEQLLQQRQDWIREKMALLQDRSETSSTAELVDGEPLLFLGNHYRLSIIRGEKDLVELDSGRLCVDLDHHSEQPAEEHCRQLLSQWYQQQARQHLGERLEFWSAESGLSYQSLKIRSYKSRWGSCDQRRRITLNERLIMAPAEIVDYVIIHELCHLVHLNHSAPFWQLVAEYCPDYQQRRRWLRNNGHQLQL